MVQLTSLDHVSINVRGVILLADPIPPTSFPVNTHVSSDVPFHLGVLSETESSDSDNEQDNDIDNDKQSQLM